MLLHAYIKKNIDKVKVEKRNNVLKGQKDQIRDDDGSRSSPGTTLVAIIGAVSTLSLMIKSGDKYMYVVIQCGLHAEPSSVHAVYRQSRDKVSPTLSRSD